MSLKSFVTIIILIAGLSLNAQDVVVKGHIYSNVNSPVEGVEIRSLNSGTTVSTDRFGSFEITVSTDQNILITKSGFIPQQIRIDTATYLVIRLEKELQVVTGYQEIPIRSLTGSVTSIEEQNFNTGIIGSPEQLVQGKAAGVRVTIGCGEPGSDTFTYIRGIASLQGSDPLFLVDGFTMPNDDPYANSTDFGRGTSHARDPLNFINPLDIEQIVILKDESSTAIYGSRGGNGVVLIKTKSGEGIKNQLQFNSQFSLSNQEKYFDLLNREQFLNGIEALGDDPALVDYGGDTDWQREINQSAFSQKYDLVFSNSYHSGNYRISFGYDNQQGIIRESGLKRITGLLSWNQSLQNNRIQIAANLLISRLDDAYSFVTTNAGFQGDLLGATYTANPTWVNDPDVQILSYSANPLSLLKYHDDQSTTKRSLFNLSANYEVSKHVSLKANVGVNNSSSNREAALSPGLYMSNGVYGNGRASIKSLDNRSDLLELTAKYERAFDHAQFNVVGGYAFQSFDRDGSAIEGWGFPDPDLSTVISDLGQSAKTIRQSLTTGFVQYGYTDDTFFVAISYPTLSLIDRSSNKPLIPVQSVKEDLFSSNDQLQSFFIKASYSINSRFFFNGSIRVDGSTLFGSNNQYGLFPSIAAAWRLSEEHFIPDLFSDLKLRASFGKSGNQNIPHDAHDPQLQFSTTTITASGDIAPPGLIIPGIKNQDLKWEEMTGLNFGLDFGFLENKLRGSLDLYKKITSDFLFYIPLAQPAPVSVSLVNSNGKIINSGIEAAIEFTAIKNNNVRLDLIANVAYNKNILKDFAGPLDVGNVYGQGLSGTTVQRFQSNQTLYSFYLPRFLGFDSNGFSIYDANGQSMIGKDPIPDLTFAFGGAIRYKNWDATILLSGLTGYSIYNNTANAFFTKGSIASARNVTTDVITSEESPMNVPEVSTRFLEGADFLRLQNLMVGRNFHFKKGPFKLIRSFFTGQNLVTWTNYSGLDPDVNTGSVGIDYSTYPKARTYTLGLQATF